MSQYTASCPSGWRSHSTSCYLVSMDTGASHLGWDNAQVCVTSCYLVSMDWCQSPGMGQCAGMCYFLLPGQHGLVPVTWDGTMRRYVLLPVTWSAWTGASHLGWDNAQVCVTSCYLVSMDWCQSPGMGQCTGMCYFLLPGQHGLVPVTWDGTMHRYVLLPVTWSAWTGASHLGWDNAQVCVTVNWSAWTLAPVTWDGTMRR